MVAPDVMLACAQVNAALDELARIDVSALSNEALHGYVCGDGAARGRSGKEVASDAGDGGGVRRGQAVGGSGRPVV